MKPYFVKTPGFMPVLYKNQIWSFSPFQKNIYLTFDDGPTPKITDWVLDVLQQYKARATFFCIGNNIKRHPSIFKRIIDEGHAIGNHTFNHENGWKTSNEDYLNSVLKTEKIIIQNTENSSLRNHYSKLFRPPYGKIKKEQSKLLIDNDYTIIMWSVLSADFDVKIDENKCLNNVIDNSSNGSIIVFHDSEKAFDKLQIVLPKVLEHFSKKGFAFKKIEKESLSLK